MKLKDILTEIGASQLFQGFEDPDDGGDGTGDVSFDDLADVVGEYMHKHRLIHIEREHTVSALVKWNYDTKFGWKNIEDVKAAAEQVEDYMRSGRDGKLGPVPTPDWDEAGRSDGGEGY